MFFNSIKEINKLISKGMCVLLFDSSIKEVNRLISKGMSNIYYILRKTKKLGK